MRAQSKARGEKLNDSLLYAQFNRDVAEVSNSDHLIREGSPSSNDAENF